MKKITLFIILIAIFVIRTNAEDGWYWQNPQPQGNALMNIHAFDSYRAIAVGGDGTIMKTDDQGIRWTIQYNVCGSASFLTAVLTGCPRIVARNVIYTRSFSSIRTSGWRSGAMERSSEPLTAETIGNR